MKRITCTLEEFKFQFFFVNVDVRFILCDDDCYRAFLFPADLQLELEYWAETGEFDEDELHEVSGQGQHKNAKRQCDIH